MKISSTNIDLFVRKPGNPFLAYLLHGPDFGLIEERANTLAHVFSPNLEDPFSAINFE